MNSPVTCSAILPLIDTHTHFDDPVFDTDRAKQLILAKRVGVQHLLLVGYLKCHFNRLFDVQKQIQQQVQNCGEQCDNPSSLQAHVALGLHPVYIDQHSDEDLQYLADNLGNQDEIIAIGEIGLDTYTSELKTVENYAKQQRYFTAQLDMAVQRQLPVLLHIRKAHGDALKILKNHAYDAHQLGGIAHSFSGGEQEAKAFVKLGFKLGVTGQISNPNAKKLRRAIQAAVATYGVKCLVIETDCPDMTPITALSADDTYQRNTPANLMLVLASLSELLALPVDELAAQLWQNSVEALRVNWSIIN